MRVCEGCGGLAVTLDREFVPLCRECAADSTVCGQRTFGGPCDLERDHDGPHACEQAADRMARAER